VCSVKACDGHQGSKTSISVLKVLRLVKGKAACKSDTGRGEEHEIDGGEWSHLPGSQSGLCSQVSVKPFWMGVTGMTKGPSPGLACQESVE
jgi:hypothetical protein